MQVLIVDDDPLMLRLYRKVVTRLGHQATAATNGREALRLMRRGSYRLLLSDWEMPQMNGLELCRRVRQRHCSSYVYIILLTVRSGTQNIIDGLSAGADEFISKPVSPDELSVRIRTGERILALERREVTMLSLAKLAQSHDRETGAHLDRMREYCRLLADHLSQQDKFPRRSGRRFRGIDLPDQPLARHRQGRHSGSHPAKSRPVDRRRIRDHEAARGERGDDVGFRPLCPSGSQVPVHGADIARSHHERFDGSGYPHGLAGDAIPLCGRIVALADVYDALTTRRVYKPPVSHRNARRIILAGRGTQFDPDIVEAFLANEARFVAIHRQYAEREEKEARLLLSLSC